MGICQLCNVNKRVIFKSTMCKIQDRDTNNVFFCGDRKNNVYIINTNMLYEYKIACLSAFDDQTNLCHRRAHTPLLEASQVFEVTWPSERPPKNIRLPCWALFWWNTLDFVSQIIGALHYQRNQDHQDSMGKKKFQEVPHQLQKQLQ